ncbi:uncharacterized protein LOC143031087 [Oratosquilla oratoria]|uniref:uncharacterized protein LOC143031087 n=1 Tax=Oratosquilla oratoria TaxID=337810 RepID=UPI003F76FDDA
MDVTGDNKDIEIDGKDIEIDGKDIEIEGKQESSVMASIECEDTVLHREATEHVSPQSVLLLAQHSVAEMLKHQQQVMADMLAIQMDQQKQVMTEVKEELRAIMGENMGSLETRANQYTDDVYHRVKEEVKEEMKAIEERYREHMQTCLDRVSTLEAVLVRQENGEIAANLDTVTWCNFAERRVAVSTITPPPSPPRSLSPPPASLQPRGECCHVNPGDDLTGRRLGSRSSELQPRGACGGGEVTRYEKERKVIEYDGKVSWDAYQAQYDVVAARHRWSQEEKAFQLVSVLKGQALEVLEHLTPAQLRCYDSVAGALRRRFGRRRQPEVFRAQLKTRRRGKDEALPLLAQDVEALVRGAYPMATEDTVDMLAKDCFVDALHDRQLQIHVKQAAPKNVREALARAAEFEAFLMSVSPAAPPPSDAWKRPSRAWARRAQASSKPSQPGGKVSSKPFKGSCFDCGQVGHKKHDCKRRARSLEDGMRPVFEPCCWNCGIRGHSSPECRQPKGVTPSAGNLKQLGAGAPSQQSTRAPQAN